ncbi:hypothetical protein OUZ56_016711 [Daphnia magna]|uniref:Uncharacterized protein n=1 Tax=Daphnia magna TaxID=35525 RepID=A0ABR0ARF4_9CRUS|nr:hypothetical protein OUZ56_016711 [Daphnia magna]
MQFMAQMTVRVDTILVQVFQCVELLFPAAQHHWRALEHYQHQALLDLSTASFCKYLPLTILTHKTSEEEIYTEIADIVLNAVGFDQDAEVELDTAVVLLLGLVGGDVISSTTYRVMVKLMTNRLGTEITWTGRSKTNEFKHKMVDMPRILAAICDAVRLHPPPEIYTSVKEWLCYSIDRYEVKNHLYKKGTVLAYRRADRWYKSGLKKEGVWDGNGLPWDIRDIQVGSSMEHNRQNLC